MPQRFDGASGDPILEKTAQGGYVTTGQSCCLLSFSQMVVRRMGTSGIALTESARLPFVRLEEPADRLHYDGSSFLGATLTV